MQRQKIHYPKHWVDVPAQIRVLESRGLVRHDSIAAASQQAWRESLEKVMAGFARRFPTFVRFTGFPVDWQTLALWK